MITVHELYEKKQSKGGNSERILELKVAPEDIGKVIGKQGRNVQSIRVILGAAGMKLKKRFILEIIEKE
jgi:predicted RNA-binding protein YlqC (UPF0109 family)